MLDRPGGSYKGIYSLWRRENWPRETKPGEKERSSLGNLSQGERVLVKTSRLGIT